MTIRPVVESELGVVLPLLAGYQRFYGVDGPDDRRNADFFRRFLAPSQYGELIAAWNGNKPSGIACLYWTFSSVHAESVALLNDLYVDEDARGIGVGRALISAAGYAARARGCTRLRWWTQIDNRRAQRLYDSMPSCRSAWFEYELNVADRGSAD